MSGIYPLFSGFLACAVARSVGSRHLAVGCWIRQRRKRRARPSQVLPRRPWRSRRRRLQPRHDRRAGTAASRSPNSPSFESLDVSKPIRPQFVPDVISFLGRHFGLRYGLADPEGDNVVIEIDDIPAWAMQAALSGAEGTATAGVKIPSLASASEFSGK